MLEKFEYKRAMLEDIEELVRTRILVLCTAKSSKRESNKTGAVTGKPLAERLQKRSCGYVP